MKLRFILISIVFNLIILVLPANAQIPVHPFQTFMLEAASLSINQSDELNAILETLTKYNHATDDVVERVSAYINMPLKDLKTALSMYGGRSEENRDYMRIFITYGLKDFPNADEIPNICNRFNTVLTGSPNDMRGMMFFSSMLQLMRGYSFGLVRIAQNGNNLNDIDFFLDSEFAYVGEKFSSAVRIMPSFDTFLLKYAGSSPFERMFNFVKQIVNSYPSEAYSFKQSLDELRLFDGTPYIDENISYVSVNGVPFTDLQEKHNWSFESLVKLTSLGIISGTGANKFNPDDVITREQFVKLLVSATDMYNKDATSSFDDVNEEQWFYPYVSSAYTSGIIQGIDSKTFGTGESITRQQMATMLYRAILKTGIKLPTISNVIFSDQAYIAEYAQEGVGAMSKAGIVKGMGDDTFAPEANATRAQAAVIIYRIMQLKK